MLGMRRSSVTYLAHRLQDKGIIKYVRGKVAITNRDALESSACECYQIIKNLYRELPARHKGGPSRRDHSRLPLKASDGSQRSLA